MSTSTDVSATAPTPTPSGGLRERLARDLPASLVVFLVALPLSLGIALASNAPIMAGVIAAVIGGVVAGLLGGAPLQVSGPAAGLTALVFAMVEQCGGDWRAVTAIVLAAGLLQLVLGFLGVARFALAISPSVVHGMLAGIGILIALGQLQVLLGHAPKSSALANLQVLPANVTAINGWSAALGVVTAAIIFAWPLLGKRAQKVPPALVAVLFVTLASIPLTTSVDRIRLTPAPATEADVAAATASAPSLLDALQLPRMPDLPAWDLFIMVLALALIASIESLLCAIATDKLHSGPRARLDRELIGQGAANTLSGLLGGLPITGVIVRSKANIDAGAVSKNSAIFHGLWLLLFVAVLGFAIESIPKAALAGLLITVGVKLVNVAHIRESRAHGELLPYVVTVAGILVRDLLTGVAVGFVVSAVMLLHKLTALTVDVGAPREGEPGRRAVDVSLTGALTFRGVPRVAANLAAIPAGVDVSVDLGLKHMDHAGWEALQSWRLAHERTGGRVTIDGLEAAWGKNPAGAPAAAPVATPS